MRRRLRSQKVLKIDQLKSEMEFRNEDISSAKKRYWAEKKIAIYSALSDDEITTDSLHYKASEIHEDDENAGDGPDNTVSTLEAIT